MKKKIFLFVFLNLYYCVYSQWIQQSSNTTADIASIFFLDLNQGWVCGSNGLILHTTNGGSNWIVQQSNTNHGLKSICFSDQNTGYAAGTFFFSVEFQFNIVLKTTNGGIEWDTVNYSVAWNNYRANSSVAFFNASTGLFTQVGSDGFTSRGNLFRTTNGGLNWQLIQFPIYIAFYKAVIVNSTTGFLLARYTTDVQGFDTTYILKTTNSGNSWNEVFRINNTGVRYISYGNNIISLSGQAGPSSGPGVIIRSTDFGTNWQNVVFGSIPSLTNSFFNNYQTGWGIGGAGLIIYTSNAGTNWSIQQQGLSYLLNDIQMFNPCSGWTAGTNGRILKTTNCGINPVINISSEIPEYFSLSQNYPNPFNPISKIKFQIAKLSEAKLVMYDVLGREVITIVNEELSPGTYEVDFDGSDLPSGVYYYRLETSNYNETKKMVLIK